MARRATPTITVKAIRFDDFDGHEFERLVFAYLLRAGWRDVAWYGQTGSDLGRDIIGVEPFDDQPARRTVIQCVNRARVPAEKVKRDMTRAASAASGKPDAFRFICRSNVSSALRDTVAKGGAALGIAYPDIWSGAEFEEHLRLRGEFLLRRFVDGMPFPDDGAGLRQFVSSFVELDDAALLTLMRLPFDRPAFWTPFYAECNLKAFDGAIGDTIGALSTGLWKSRDGAEIQRLPSVEDIADPTTRAKLKQLVRKLDKLRRLFQRRVQDGSIVHCQCGDPTCSMFQLSNGVGDELDAARQEILDGARAILPDFDVYID